MLKHRRAHLFKEGRLTPDCDLDFEETFNKLVIYGSLDKISDKLLLFREKAGDLDALLYDGYVW